MDKKQYSPTQPVCDECWITISGDRSPVRLVGPESEQCCFCGNGTMSGILVRVDPLAVPFPTKLK